MDILGVIFDVDGWFNFGNVLYVFLNLLWFDLWEDLFKLIKYLDSFMKLILKFFINEIILIKFVFFW